MADCVLYASNVRDGHFDFGPIVACDRFFRDIHIRGFSRADIEFRIDKDDQYKGIKIWKDTEEKPEEYSTYGSLSGVFSVSNEIDENTSVRSFTLHIDFPEGTSGQSWHYEIATDLNGRGNAHLDPKIYNDVDLPPLLVWWRVLLRLPGVLLRWLLHALGIR